MFNLTEFDEILFNQTEKDKIFIDFENFTRAVVGNKFTHIEHVTNIGFIRCRCDNHIDFDDCWLREVIRIRNKMLPEWKLKKNFSNKHEIQKLQIERVNKTIN